MNSKRMLMFGLLLLVALVMAGCAGTTGEQGEPGPAGPPGPEGPAGSAAVMVAEDLTCTECHNETTLITGKKAAWEQSLHGSGESTEYAGSREGCAGCHSGGAFKEMVAAGLTPSEFEGGDPNATHQDCRTCHEVHTSYTGADWVLTTSDPVTLIAFEDAVFDGGEGNLCGVCHQPRRQIAEADADGNIEVTSTHWGPHHGPQTAMLLGIGGGGEVEGNASSHYSLVEDTCVSCHVGENDNHNFEPQIAACQGCHSGLEDFDLNGLQTEVEGLLTELEEALVAKGMWDHEEDHPVVGVYPAAEAQALWNYIFISHEDESLGVHNPAYTKALLEASLEAVK
jgi:hypothetical protein